VAEDTTQSQSRSWLEYVAVSTGVIAVLGVLTYAQGILMLWIPIWRTYSGDASTAWYATSLVPKTVVAGLGIGQLVMSGTKSTIMGIIAYLLSSLVPRYSQHRWGNKARPIATWLLVAGFAVYAAWIFASVFREVFSWNLLMSVAAGVVTAIILPFSIALLASAVLKRWRKRTSAASTQEGLHKGHVDSAAMKGEAPESANDNLERFSLRWLWPGWSLILIVSAGFYVLITFSVVMSDPALPSVEASGAKDMKGALLTHTDGFWYIFDVEGENKGELVALRDDQVETVTLSSNSE